MHAKRSTTVSRDVWRMNILSEDGRTTYLEVLHEGNVAASLNVRFETVRAPSSECAAFLDECIDLDSLSDDEADVVRVLRASA